MVYEKAHKGKVFEVIFKSKHSINNGIKTLKERMKPSKIVGFQTKPPEALINAQQNLFPAQVALQHFRNALMNLSGHEF